MPRFQDNAICLRSREWSETSQIVVLLTQTRGKIRGLAKGSKRMSPSSVARFSGGIELMQQGEVVATIRSTAELANVTEWDLHDDHPRLRRDYAAAQRALYAADLTDRLIADEDPHPAVYDALSAMLDDAEGDDAALLRYQWALLGEAGYRPELFLDVHDGEALSDAGKVWFDPRGGGLTRRNGVSDWRVTPATIAALRSLDEAADFEDEEQDAVRRANRLLAAYARHLLDAEPATMRFLFNSQ